MVFVLCLLLSLGVKALVGQVEDDSSALQHTTGLVGTTVSGVFLLVIGVINLVILLGILRVFRQMRAGAYDEAALEAQLNGRGLLNRVLGRATRAVRKPWQMYPVGLLFGLGFDTATEVSLLVLAGGAAAFSLPWYAILTLPVLFAAGMSLLDTIDGCFMNFAYGWAFSKPVRKVYYNITVTACRSRSRWSSAASSWRPCLPKSWTSNPGRWRRWRPRPQLRRLRHRGVVRPDLAGGPGRMAARAHRGEVDRAAGRRRLTDAD